MKREEASAPSLAAPLKSLLTPREIRISLQEESRRFYFSNLFGLHVVLSSSNLDVRCERCVFATYRCRSGLVSTVV